MLCVAKNSTFPLFFSDFCNMKNTNFNILSLYAVCTYFVCYLCDTAQNSGGQGRAHTHPPVWNLFSK